MYIRRTQTRSSVTGERYYTFRLVRTARTADGKVRQVTLLNLGRHFAIAKDHWRMLCERIEQLLSHQQSLLPVDCPAAIEREAQRCAAQYLAQHGEALASPHKTSGGEAEATQEAAHEVDLQHVDVNTLELTRPRSVAIESLGLWAMEQLGIIPLLNELGFNGVQCSAAVGSIIARMAAPGSERAAHRWLGHASALGELLDVDFERMSPVNLYRASDLLERHHETIERRVFERISGLLGLEATITLYDLTNTYFEGELAGNPSAVRGHSKEKRSDSPLVTLGLVLDASGFVRRSRVFAGNASECRTLQEMVDGLGAPKGALVVMDRGVATADNLEWLRTNGYRYLVVSRERKRDFDGEQAITLETAASQIVRVHKVLSSDGSEVRLYCYSEERSEKEQGINQRFFERFEKGLQKLHDGLSKPKSEKRIEKLWERIGRLKESSHGIAQHYQIEVIPAANGTDAKAVMWQQIPVAGTRATHPGVYCLRSTETDWSEARLWKTYIMLTDLEAVFRSLKSELGLRPVYHRKEERVNGHLFISVLAYQLVQFIRCGLQKENIRERWQTLRSILENQYRVTAVFRRADGRALHIRKTTRPEPDQAAIYKALGLDQTPGGVKKTLY